MPRTPQNPHIRLLDGAFYASEPHDLFAWMRRHAPVYFDETSGVWGVASYEGVMTASKSPERFCNAGGIRPDAPPMPFMINLDDPLHKKRRGLVNRGFTPRRVAAREPRIREICVDLLEKARSMGSFDWVRDVACWLPLIVIGDMLGVDPADHHRLLQWSDEMVKASGAADPEVAERGARAFEEYSEYQRRVIADRRSRPPQSDLVSILVHAEIDGQRLSDEEILWESLLILIGGDETTRHVISGGMYELLRDRGQWEKLVEHPEKIPVAVEEMLRWVTPIKNMARTATCDTELLGQRIRAGEKLLLLLYPSANRDETVFPGPDRFDIERWPNPHLAFGWGPHYCLGANLARLELRVMFEEAVRRVPDLELASDEPPPRRISNFISGIESLPVRVRG